MKKLFTIFIFSLLSTAATANVTKKFYSSEDDPITYSGPFDGKGIAWFQRDFCVSRNFDTAIDSKFEMVGWEMVFKFIECSRLPQTETFESDDGKAILYFGPSDGKGLSQFENKFCQDKGYQVSFDRDYTRYSNVVLYHSISCTE